MKEAQLVRHNTKFQYLYPVHGAQPMMAPLGQKEGRYCIFCGKSESETTFIKKAHIIPVALGNKHLTNWNECDTCNEHIFSGCEDDLVNFLAMDRILIRGKKRQGKPKLKPSTGNSFITSEPGSNKVSIEIDSTETPFVKFEGLDTDHANMTFTDLPKYSYVNICKALVHMGWSVMENDWETLNKKYDYVYPWLKGDLDIFPLFMDQAFIPGGLSHVVFEVLESQDKITDFPFAFRLSYGFKVITFYLPASRKINSEPKGIAQFNFVPNNGLINVDRLSILRDERITPDYVSYGFKFNRYESSKNVIDTE